MSWDCAHKRINFLSGQHGMGSGISYRHDVSICLDCGEIRVFGYKNGQSFDIKFHLVTDEAIAAAGKYLEAIREDERARKMDDKTPKK